MPRATRPPERWSTDGDRLGGDDRVALGDEEDAGAEAEALGGHRGGAPRATSGSRVRLYFSSMGVRPVGHRPRRPAARRDVGVLGQPERVEAPLLERPGQLDDADRQVGGEDGDAVAHRPDSDAPSDPVHHGRPWQGSVKDASSSSPVRAGASAGPTPWRSPPRGPQVVVNDLGAELDGTGGSTSPAQEVVAEIEAGGGEAIVNGDDVADWAGAPAAGRDGRRGLRPPRRRRQQRRLRARPHVRVVLRGGVGRRRAGPPQGPLLRVPPRRRVLARPGRRPGEPVDARIINTSSGAGILGSVGQSAYSAAKAGIAALTLVQAAELGRYGVTANAIAPAARTRMTEGVFAEMMAAVGEGQFDAMDPANVVPARRVARLVGRRPASPARCSRSRAARSASPRAGTTARRVDNGDRWQPADVGARRRRRSSPRPAPPPPSTAPDPHPTVSGGSDRGLRPTTTPSSIGA